MRELLFLPGSMKPMVERRREREGEGEGLWVGFPGCRAPIPVHFVIDSERAMDASS